MPVPNRKLNALKSHWGKLVLATAIVSTFLGNYDTIRNKGNLFLCDVATIVGKRDSFQICRNTKPEKLSITEQFALLDQLKKRQEHLTPSELEQISALENILVDKTIDQLTRAIEEKKQEVEGITISQARMTVRETLEEGTAEEREALEYIAKGNVQKGLTLLTEQAQAATLDVAKKWRKIAELSFFIDTSLSIKAYEKVLKLDTSDPWDTIYLGRLYERSGLFAEAIHLYDSKINELTSDNDFEKAVLISYYGDVLFKQGDNGSAKHKFTESLRLLKNLAITDKSNARRQRAPSLLHIRLGRVHVQMGNLDEAKTEFEIARQLHEKLLRRYPDDPDRKRDSILSLLYLGSIFESLEDYDKAIELYENADELNFQLIEIDPQKVLWQQDRGIILDRFGLIKERQEDLNGALDNYNKSKNITESRVDKDPKNLDLKYDLGISYVNLGRIYLAQNKDQKALEAYSRANSIYMDICKTEPNSIEWQRSLSWNHHTLGTILEKMGKQGAALEHYMQHMEFVEREGRSNPSNESLQLEVISGYMSIGELAKMSNLIEVAISSFEKCKLMMQKIKERFSIKSVLVPLKQPQIDNADFIEVTEEYFSKQIQELKSTSR